jgi:ferric-dicitrate binding protein FerR (iron transport regulator)
VTRPHEMDHDRIHALMMAVLDEECTEAERRQLEDVLAARPGVAAEWDRLRRVKEVTMTMGVRQPPEEIWDRYRESTLQRLERGLAWILIAMGGAVLVGWGCWVWLSHWLADTSVPIVVRVAGVALAAGLFLLLVSAVRERWFLYRRDPYAREVIR